MKIAVIGTGAMGSVYAALLADAGNDVWAVDTWEPHIDAIRAQGLRVEGASGDRLVRLEATTSPEAIGTVDLVIIATKAMDVCTAAASALPLLGPDTVVLPIQNGLGSVQAVVQVVGVDPVIVGVAGGFGASVVAPGHVHHHGLELVRLGERQGPVSDRVERVACVWRDAGFRVQTYDDVDRLVWGKLICNVCFSGPCAVLDTSIGEVMASESAWRVASTCAAEAYEVAVARGIDLDFDDPVEHVRAFGAAIPDAHPSVLLDLRSGRRSEIGVINGAIPREARRVGKTAPVNEAVTALVRALEERAAGAGS